MAINPALLVKLFEGAAAAKDFFKSVAGDMRNATNAAKGLTSAWVELQDTAFKTARAMNLGREAAMRYNRELMANTRELAVQYGITAENIAEFQKSYATAVGRNIHLTRQQISQIAALGNITDDATAQSLLDEFDKIGVSIENAFAGTVQIQEQAKYLGLNGAKASKTLASNIKLATSYSFRNGVRDIQEMALKAQSVRMDMNAVMSAAEKFMDIESSISTAANIQMLGGSFAQNFSNPMAVMYESMADPKALMDRIQRTIEGKGTYNEKTGEVTFDQITMRMMREMAKNLGMSVEELTKPAIAQAQGRAVEQEIAMNSKLAGISKEQVEAIKNLSRANFDEKTGEHYITYIDDNRETQTVKLSELTADQLKIAQDSQLTQDNMWKDVHDIREYLLKIGDERARGTVSLKDEIKGLGQWIRGIWGGLLDSIMGPISNKANANKSILGDTGDLRDLWSTITGFFGGAHAKGGVVGRKYATGTPNATAGIVGGAIGGVDKLWAWLTKGEMVLNMDQQKSLFSLIKSLGRNTLATGLLNKIGGTFGVDNLGGMMMMRRMGMFGPQGSLIGGGILPDGKDIVINAANVVLNGNISGLGNQTALLENVAQKTEGANVVGKQGALYGKNIGKLRTIAKAKNALKVAGRGFGKSIPYIGTILAAGSALSDWSGANSAFGDKRSEIESMNVSDLTKAKELDKAIKARNQSRGGAVGTAVGAGIGMALGSVFGPLGTVAGGWLGSKAGEFIGKGIGGLFTGKNEEEYRKANMTGSTVAGVSGETANEMLKVLRHISGRVDDGIKINPVTMRALTLSLPTMGIKGSMDSPVTPKPNTGNAMQVAPVEVSASKPSIKPIDIAPKDINLNVSGSIRLEGNGSSANLDVEKLLGSSEFVRQLTEIIKNRMNEISNSGRIKGETYMTI